MDKQLNKTIVKNDNKRFVNSSDPRIDSPEIKVVYPSVTHDLPRYEAITTEEPTTDYEPIPIPDPPKKEEDEKHECKVGWLDAIKQNGTPFLLLILLAFGLGYIIGKK